MPKVIIRRGKIVYEDGKITAKTGTGKTIPRKGTQVFPKNINRLNLK